MPGHQLRSEQWEPGDGSLPPGSAPAAAAQGAWPPPWKSPDGPTSLPGLSWPPTADQLDYWQKAITVTLLVLALPALAAALAHRPERLLTGLARRHVA